MSSAVALVQGRHFVCIHHVIVLCYCLCLDIRYHDVWLAIGFAKAVYAPVLAEVVLVLMNLRVCSIDGLLCW